MHRSTSPIRHDYKPGATTSTRKRSLPVHAAWFAAGLGLPIIVVVVMLISREPAEQAATTRVAPPLTETRTTEPSAVVSAPGPTVAAPIPEAIAPTYTGGRYSPV